MVYMCQRLTSGPPSPMDTNTQRRASWLAVWVDCTWNSSPAHRINGVPFKLPSDSSPGSLVTLHSPAGCGLTPHIPWLSLPLLGTGAGRFRDQAQRIRWPNRTLFHCHLCRSLSWPPRPVPRSSTERYLLIWFLTLQEADRRAAF